MLKLPTRVLGAFFAFTVTAGFAELGLGGDFSVEGGCRWDDYRQSGNAPAVSGTYIRNKIKKNYLGTFDINARATFDDAAYFRIVGRYGGPLTKPQREVTVGSTTTLESIDHYGFAYDVGAAVGYTFDLFAGDFLIAPEFGYTYSRLKVDEAEFIGFGAPFAGAVFKWVLVKTWILNIQLDYYFAGSRREKLTPPIADITTGSSPLYITKGRAQGPEGSILLGYDFNSSWTLGVKYRLKYLFTNERTLNGDPITWAEKTAWTTNNISLQLGYIF